MIDSKHLQLILAIHQCGSMSKASQQLNLTQSALSHQLKNLEESLGVALFHRVGNQLHFTEAGKEFKEKGSTIIKDLNALELRLREIKESQLSRYIHGYSETEAQRLHHQANSIADHLHFDSTWEKGATILEVGCGVGAQTVIIADKNPDCKIVSIDISKKSIVQAQQKVQKAGITNVEFRLQDVNELIEAQKEMFDHVFICFVLEHMSEPQRVLRALRSIIKPGGTMTVIEGDHGSTFFYPDNSFARKVIEAQVKLQQEKGGNANIGRALYPLLNQAGFKDIVVSPRQIYVDPTRPRLVEGFIKNTFIAMIQGMSEAAFKAGLLSKSDYDLGIAGLLRTAETDGVFSYTFFKGKGFYI